MSIQPGVLRRPEPVEEDVSRTLAHRDGPADWRGNLSDDGIGWIAAHGGAGVTTLSGLLGGFDIGCRWPDRALGEPARVMLVGRSSMDGLRAVSRALRVMNEGRHPAGMRLVGVVLIADAPGSLPAPLTSRIRLLRSVAPVHRIPWIPSLRLGEAPRKLPRQLVRLGGVAHPAAAVPRSG